VPTFVAFVIVGTATWPDTTANLVAASVQESSRDATPRSQNSSGSVAMIWEPPTAEFWQSVPNANATVPKEMVSKIVVSGAPVILETTQLRAIATRFGASIGARGEAGNSVRWLCFRGSNPGGKWALWLESYEIDGRTVGGFQWQRISNGAVFDRRCRMLNAGSVELPGGLRLGLIKEEVKTILGEPTARQGDRAVYVHSHKESIRGEPFTSVNVVEVLFREGKVQAIGVSKTTTD
jgi:hypothetical protein